MNSSHKGQWCGALILSLTCACLNGWVDNREAGDLRRNRAHYDVTVMLGGIPPSIHHGGARKAASHGMPVSSLRLVFRGFNELWQPALRLYLYGWDMKSRYAPESNISELYFSSGCWVEINRRYCVELIPHSIKPLSHTLKTNSLVHFKGCGSATHMFRDIPQYLHTPKHNTPIYQSLIDRRAYSSWPCWMLGGIQPSIMV